MSPSKGSAVVEFVLVSVPLLIFSTSVVFVSLFAYARNIATYAAIESVHFAALADQDSAAGEAKARQMLQGALKFATAEVLSERLANNWLRLEVRLDLAKLGPLLSAAQLKVVAYAPAELR